MVQYTPQILRSTIKCGVSKEHPSLKFFTPSKRATVHPSGPGIFYTRKLSRAISVRAVASGYLHGDLPLVWCEAGTESNHPLPIG